jgi:hypothetical protein
MTHQKQLENAEYFTYLGSKISDGRCTREMKTRTVIAKAEFNKKKKTLSPANWI